MSANTTGPYPVDEAATIAALLANAEFANHGISSGLLTTLADHQSHEEAQVQALSDSGSSRVVNTVRWLSVSKGSGSSDRSRLSTFSLALARYVQTLEAHTPFSSVTWHVHLIKYVVAFGKALL
jgi:hypothetical protein